MQFLQTSPGTAPTINYSVVGSNPLAPVEGLRARSAYLDPSEGRLRYRFAPTAPVHPADQQACDALQAQVLSADYPCVMARSVFNHQAFRMGRYAALGDAGNAALLCHDLYEFSAEHPTPVGAAVSFIACFDGAVDADELSFERRMWAQLRALSEVDAQFFRWADDVDADPASPAFSFSIGGRAFFLIGMHAGASRLARCTPRPMIVFNLHEQFVELRRNGKFDGVRRAVQTRDLRLQGSVNPMSADFGARSEAAQYAGREVGRDWRCPFTASSPA